ncbi:conserved hypothetical protein [uncultured Pleomorphomonas sp.]|uniref:ASCH domain-containing protein n=1 Tax=uncultured Pleomorphomonas sp. TaxID=442121 RepID=A0A212L219_9HYPH|nr:hypothetical protein [uncultured Pleomorphomonas sp.]SCM71614.1 conserved hypothetical protein [uncultured Pleomorphomonas sp.]
MVDRPILFSAPMVRAIIAGRKTQTRRVMPPRPLISVSHGRAVTQHADGVYRAPPTKFAVGDRLWVRETVRAEELEDGTDGVRYLADGAFRPIENSDWAADRWGDLFAYRGKRGATVPPIHMPRWVSRLTLLVTDVRVERLRDISEDDAIAEGVAPRPNGGFCVPGVDHPNRDFPYLARPTAREMYAALWDVINGSGAWAANPWVAAYTFDEISGGSNG